jgi:hypothetical protein
MANNYRLKYKHGDFELEIESTDKAFVESKLKELIQQEQERQPLLPKNPAPKHKTGSSTDPGDEDSNSNIDVAKVVNEINDSDKHSVIEKEIINRSNRLKRILLVLYFSNELYPQVPITTGEIEKITDQLGIKIASPNVASAIKENLKFFTADAVRKRGAIVKYKINKKGIDEIKKILGIK